MDTPSIPPPVDLAAALVELRDHAHELAEKLEDLWCDSVETEDRIEADQLDPLLDEAVVLAATLDAVQHRVTGQPMTTNIGKRLKQIKQERAQGPA